MLGNTLDLALLINSRLIRETYFLLEFYYTSQHIRFFVFVGGGCNGKKLIKECLRYPSVCPILFAAEGTQIFHYAPECHACSCRLILYTDLIYKY
jgi:hypothetical protein